MIDIKNEKWPFLKILIISLIINGYAGVNNFHFLSYSGDAVGPILEFFQKIKILVCSSVISLILVFVLSRLKNFKSNYIAVIITLLISAYLADLVSFNLAYTT